jgi:hypothetical protein
LHDAGPRITELALRFKADELDKPVAHDPMDALLRALARGSQGSMPLVVEVPATRMVDAKTWLTDTGFDVSKCTILDVPDDQMEKGRTWPRDSMLCAIDGNGRRLAVRPAVSPDEYSFADTLVRRLGLSEIAMRQIVLDGGNFLTVDDDRWLVGASAIEQTAEAKNLSWDAAKAAICDALGPKAILVGASPTALSLSTRWGLAKINVRNRRKRRAKRRHHRQWPSAFEELIVRFSAAARFIHELIAPQELTMAGFHLDMTVAVAGPDAAGVQRLLVADPTDPACQPSDEARYAGHLLKLVAGDLASKGFQVGRNPAPYVINGILPYTNVIVQTGPNIVWMPVFAPEYVATAAMDARNRQFWCDFGYHVIEVSGWFTHANIDGGSIRCATLATRRGSVPVSAPAEAS